MRIATHGVALLLGVVAWHALLSARMSDVPQLAKAGRHARSREAAGQASAWIDASLAKLREEDAEKEQEGVQPATMAEFLEKGRKEAEQWWRTRNEELDQIVAGAHKVQGLTDPAAAIRAVRRNKHSYEEELALFQHWLETDPDAALAELGGNWHLLELEYTMALLERRFGAAWMAGKIADEEIPYRLRTALAHELGRQSAHGRGLAGLSEFYNSIPDPRLKIQMAWHFTFEWPLDEPQTVARFLGGDVPRELRDVLLEQWAHPAYGPDPWELEWMRELCEALGPDQVQNDFDPSAGMYDPMAGFRPAMERWKARESMTLDEVVQDCRRAGSAPEDALGEAIRTKMHHALDGAPDLVELFGEGQLTRAGLLGELRRRIPGLDAYPDALEREVWRKTARVADPQEIADWAEELARRGDSDELMTQTFATGNIYGDPRIPLRLARYRTITKGMPEDRPRSRILGHAAWEWTRWQDVSPAAAEAWRDGLPPHEPLVAAIREEEELERRRRGNP